MAETMQALRLKSLDGPGALELATVPAPAGGPHQGSPLKPGDRVVANASLGGWAEVAVASPFVTFPIPDGMSFAQATSMVNYQTAVFAFTERGGLKPGEAVLIPRAAGGPGA